MVTAFGMTVALLATVVSVPQLVRTARTRNVDGLSVAFLVGWLSSHAAWLAYEVHVRDVPTISYTAAAFATDAALLLLVLRYGPGGGWRSLLDWRRSWTAACLPLFAAAWLITGPEAAVIGLIAADVVVMLPQVVEVFRARSLRGISVLTWLLLALEDAGWVAYANLAGLPLLAGAAYLLLPLSLVVLSRAVAYRIACRRAGARAGLSGRH